MKLMNFEEQERVDLERNITWENNHVAITKAIDFLVRQNERMPTQTEIATETGLSRKTVCMHLFEFKNRRREVVDLDQFNFMASKVLGKIMEKAMDGDMRASRLALQTMGIIGRQRVSKSPEEAEK
jgi:predicted transcriptional regulator